MVLYTVTGWGVYCIPGMFSESCRALADDSAPGAKCLRAFVERSS